MEHALVAMESKTRRVNGFEVLARGSGLVTVFQEPAESGATDAADGGETGSAKRAGRRRVRVIGQAVPTSVDRHRPRWP